MRYDETSEDRSALERVPALRRHNGEVAGIAARRVPDASRGMEGRARNAWAEAEGQAVFRRFPRPCRSASILESGFRLRRRLLAGEFFPGEALPDGLTNRNVKPL